VINAPVHLIRCDKSVDEFHDADGSLVCSKSAWAGATRGPLRTYQVRAIMVTMLHSPHLAANAALLAEIFAAIFPTDSSEGARPVSQRNAVLAQVAMGSQGLGFRCAACGSRPGRWLRAGAPAAGRHRLQSPDYPPRSGLSRRCRVPEDRNTRY
jgi:hypothetical protein